MTWIVTYNFNCVTMMTYPLQTHSYNLSSTIDMCCLILLEDIGHWLQHIQHTHTHAAHIMTCIYVSTWIETHTHTQTHTHTHICLNRQSSEGKKRLFTISNNDVCNITRNLYDHTLVVIWNTHQNEILRNNCFCVSQSLAVFVQYLWKVLLPGSYQVYHTVLCSQNKLFNILCNNLNHIFTTHTNNKQNCKASVEHT